MSRLHDPGPGEILDRLTILALKIVYGQQAGRDTTQWTEETAALVDLILVQTWRMVLTEWNELAAVNAALWSAEDEMRALRDTPEAGRVQWTGFHGDTWLHAAGKCGMKIQALNDRRATLVRRINTEAGIARPSDKV